MIQFGENQIIKNKEFNLEINDMTLPEDFKSLAQKRINQFLEQFTASSNELIYREHGILSSNPEDFNLGNALGFLEGTISTEFLDMYERQMTAEENNEIRRMIAKITPKIKQLIFDAKHR